MLYPKSYYNHVSRFASEYKVSEYLVLSVIKSESTFRESILSPVGAVGLMQLMPYTANNVSSMIGLGKVDEQSLVDPEINIRFGTFYLRKLLNEFKGNIPLVASAYNAGPHRVTKWIKENDTNDMDEFIELIPYFETRKYTKKVLSYYGVYNFLNNASNSIVAINPRITEDLQIGPFPLKEMWHLSKWVLN